MKIGYEFSTSLLYQLCESHAAAAMCISPYIVCEYRREQDNPEVHNEVLFAKLPAISTKWLEQLTHVI